MAAGFEPPGPGLMSETRDVPAAVPSVTQSSVPWVPSSARRTSCPGRPWCVQRGGGGRGGAAQPGVDVVDEVVPRPCRRSARAPRRVLPSLAKNSEQAFQAVMSWMFAEAGPGLMSLTRRVPVRRPVGLLELLAVGAVAGEEEGRGADRVKSVGSEPIPACVDLEELRGSRSRDNSVRPSRASGGAGVAGHGHGSAARATLRPVASAKGLIGGCSGWGLEGNHGGGGTVGVSQAPPVRCRRGRGSVR